MPTEKKKPDLRIAPKLRDWEVLATDAVGEAIEFWGFKHNQGRVWGLLYLRAQPMTAGELQRLLGLSKGAVSMLLKDLEQWKVVRKVRPPGSAIWHFEQDWLEAATLSSGRG